MSHALDRAVEAEAQLQSARERIAFLERRLRDVLGEDVDVRDAKLSGLQNRAHGAEKLLAEFDAHLRQHPWLWDELPDAYGERLRAQLHSAGIYAASKTPEPLVQVPVVGTEGNTMMGEPKGTIGQSQVKFAVAKRIAAHRQQRRDFSPGIG